MDRIGSIPLVTGRVFYARRGQVKVQHLVSICRQALHAEFRIRPEN